MDTRGIDDATTRYLVAHGLDGVVRIWGDEYAGIPYTKDGDLFAHFNPERVIAEVGQSYQLPRILEHGHLDADGSETLPKLSFKISTRASWSK